MKRNRLFYLILMVVVLACCLTAAACKNGDDGKTTELTLNKTTAVIEKGESITLTATLPDGVEGELSWYSYDTEIVTVDNGVVKGVGVGNTTVLAMVDDLTASCNVSVINSQKDAEMLTVEVNKSKLVLDSESVDGKNFTLISKIFYNGTEVNCDVTWQSDNEEYVTVNNSGVVTAVKNGGKAILSATASYNNVSTTCLVEVYTEKFAVISVDKEQIELYPGNTQILDYALLIDGVDNQTEKANVKFSSSNLKSVMVSATGELTAVSKGTSVIEIKYGSNVKQILVRVSDVVFVTSAQEFLQIDGGDSAVRYVLKNNIDLGDYLFKNTLIGDDCLIENFNAILDGNGYAITGITRFSGSDDHGFSGIFKNVSASAVIENITIRANLETEFAGALFAKNFLGTMRNSKLEIKAVTAVNEFGGTLFENSNGKISYCVFNVDYTDLDGLPAVFTALSNYGLAKYDKCLIISQSVDYGALTNGEGSLVNTYFSDCYYCADESLVAIKSFDGNGIGDDASVNITDLFSSEKWEVQNGIYLKNATNQYLSQSPAIASVIYQDVEVETEVNIQTPVISDGATFSFRIIDGQGQDVTTQMVNGLVFKPYYSGDYTIIMKASKDGLSTIAIAVVIVYKNQLKANATSVLLRPTETFSLQIDGYQSADLTFYTENSKIATVDGNGQITAVGEGTTKIKAVSKNSIDYFAINVDVVTDYETINTASELLAIDGATSDKYYVLTDDIDLSDVEFKKHANESDATQIYEYLIKTFAGTLDGQGYTIKVRYNSSLPNIMCGMFYKLDKTGVVKNVVYDFEGRYVRTTKSVYLGVFAYYSLGTVKDSYFNAVCYPDKDLGGEGFIAVFQNEDAKFPTAYAYNCIFNMTTIVNGNTIDSGFAFRYGSRQPRATDCIFIRNGETVAFFGEHPNGSGSAVENTDCYFYRTLYDFVNAHNGYSYSTRKVITPVSEGKVVYHDWVNHWSINKEQISLCGKKVIDVEYEHYEENSAMSLSNEKGVISWENKGEFEVYLEDKLIATVKNGSFNVAEYVLQNMEVVDADYGIVVRNGSVSGATIFKFRTLNQSNFVSRIHDSTINSGSEYFVMTENVSLDYGVIGTVDGTFMATKAEWDANPSKQYIQAEIKLWNCFYAFGNLTATLNGMGYTLTLDFSGAPSYIANTWKHVAGLFTQITGGVENLNYYYKMNKNANTVENYGFFAGVIGANAAVKNCMFKAEVDLNSYTDSGDLTGIICRVDGLGVSDCVFDMIVLEDGELAMENYDIIGGVNKTTNTINNCLFIKYFDQQQFSATSVPNNNAITSGYTAYESYQALKTDELFNNSDIWSIDEGNIKLCGKNVINPVIVLSKNGSEINGYKFGVNSWDVYRYNVQTTSYDKIDTINGSQIKVDGLLLLDKVGLLVAGEKTYSEKFKFVSSDQVYYGETTVEFTITGLNDQNFVSVMRTATKDGSTAKYVLIENVTLDYGAIGTTDGTFMATQAEWNANKTKQYASADIKVWNVFYAFGTFAGEMNGLGYKLTLDLSGSVSYVGSVWKVGGLFTQLTGSIENLHYEYKSKLIKSIAENYGFFVGVVGANGIVTNCVLKAQINMNGFTDTGAITGMFARIDGNGVSNSIIDFKVVDASNTAVSNQYNAIGGMLKSTMTISNVVWIKNGTQIFSLIDNNPIYAVTTGYTTYENYALATADTLFVRSTVWSVDSGSVKLCGKVI